MNWAARRLKHMVVVISLCILGGNSAMLYFGLRELVDAAEWVRHSLSVKQALSDVVAELAKAESAKRGYLLTGDVLELGNYYVFSKETGERVKALRDLVLDNNTQIENVKKITNVIDEKFLKMSEAIQLNISGDTDRAKEFVRIIRDSRSIEIFKDSLDKIKVIEDGLLQERRDNVDIARRSSFFALGGFVAVALLLLLILYYLTSREIRQKTQASHEIKKVADELHRQADVLTRDRNEITLLNEASSFLQSCNTIAEISSACPPFMRKLFPDHHGAVFLTAASRNRLDLLATWGGEDSAGHFAPQHCWGLRRGQIHMHAADTAAPLCEHLSGLDGDTESLCVPLVAHGETIGLLTLWRIATTPDDVDQFRMRRLVDMVARQLGLTVANIRLRESLKEQTIRDAMTNAFNRRYLDVVSKKEVAKARRFSRQMVVAMIDIDHFKRFNDTQGHPAGDTALITVSQYLQQSIRESDWLFRYGGEEFLMILTDTDTQEATIRLDTLRVGIAQLVIQHEGTPLPQVTISCGIAAFPTHADDFDGIVSLADEALYNAKQAGRNCVRVALEETAVSR